MLAIDVRCLIYQAGAQRWRSAATGSTGVVLPMVKLVILRKQHLREVVNQFAAHYHLERNHQGIGWEWARTNHGM